MPSAHISFKEEDVVKLMLEFLQKRELGISQLSVERETGVVNGVFSDDVLFLRQLILDGQWDDVIDFVQPLNNMEEFDFNKFKYVVLRHKYLELFCIRSETGGLLLQPPTTSQFGDLQIAVDEVVKCLNELEKVCPTKEEYNELCLLLTLPQISDHPSFKNWNPSNSRIKCFSEIQPLVVKFLPVVKKGPDTQSSAQCDRLIQLIVKGLLYESCVTYCQQKATSGPAESGAIEMKFQPILNASSFSDSDLSLMSWLESVPTETFSCAFEQKSLSLNVQELVKPTFEAAWTEQILATPIKPKRFPHSAMPYRSRSVATELMSRSLAPNLESILSSNKHLMTMSVGDLAAMSKSFAGFHLNGKKAMNTSMDRLFSDSDVFNSSYADLPSIMEAGNKSLGSSMSSEKSTSKLSDDNKLNESKITSQNVSLADKSSSHSLQNETKTTTPNVPSLNESSSNSDMSQSKSDLLQEFHRHKQMMFAQFESNDKISPNNSSAVISTQVPADMSQSTYDLLQQFQRHKQMIMNQFEPDGKSSTDNRAHGEYYLKNNSNVSNNGCSNTEYTPPNVQGVAKYPGAVDYLTTSTPRNDRSRLITPSPHASPVYRNPEMLPAHPINSTYNTPNIYDKPTESHVRNLAPYMDNLTQNTNQSTPANSTRVYQNVQFPDQRNPSPYQTSGIPPSSQHQFVQKKVEVLRRPRICFGFYR